MRDIGSMMRLLSTVALALLVVGSVGCGKVENKLADHIEVVGTELTGVDVGVEKVNLSVFKAAGGLSGITVGNPDGYLADWAFHMGEVYLNVGLFSFFGKDPIVIDKMVIDSPVVNLELHDRDESNLQEIVQHSKNHQQEADEKSAELKDGKKKDKKKD